MYGANSGRRPSGSTLSHIQETDLMRRQTQWGALALLVVTSAPALSAQANWTTYGGNDWNQRYSTLAQITPANAGRLVPRMVFQTGIGRLGSFENTPVVVDNMMYVTTPYNTAIAYDLNTGKQVWRYEHKLGTTIYCCGPNNRGVAVHGPHVYMGTLDGRLVEMVEIPDHPWFIACQFHPEFTSTPRDGHPLFTGFIRAALKYQGGAVGRAS